MHNDKYISVILELPSLKRLSAWERKILKIVVEQGMWRIRTNQKLRDLYKDLDIIADIKRDRLVWIGYAVRMGQGRAVIKYLRVKGRKVEEG